MDPTSSMQYTIGTALSRAQDFGHTVEVLVDGQWVAGLVVANDGVGVVLDNDGREHCVVRLESVSAVKVSAAAPVRRPARNGMHVDRTLDGAVVMPSPRATTE